MIPVVGGDGAGARRWGAPPPTHARAARRSACRNAHTHTPPTRPPTQSIEQHSYWTDAVLTLEASRHGSHPVRSGRAGVAGVWVVCVRVVGRGGVRAIELAVNRSTRMDNPLK